MAGSRSYEKWLLALVLGLVALLVFSVKGSLDTRRWKGSFQNEMAQRLDLEEVVSGFENERAAWHKQASSLRAELNQVRQSAEQLKLSLDEERAARRILEERLRQINVPAAANQDAAL